MQDRIMKITEIVEQILTIRMAKGFVFVSICGSADTGKSTLAGQICNELRVKNINCDFICTDSFMIDRVDRIAKGISGYNLKSLREKELLEIVENIQNEKEIKYFPYDNKLGKNISEYRTIKNIEVLIIEGLHSFNEIIRSKIDLKIFINANDKILRQLRFEANINKRGFTEREARERIGEEMREYYHFVEPNKKHSDIILNIDGNYNYS